jgi:polyferredoxin
MMKILKKYHKISLFIGIAILSLTIFAATVCYAKFPEVLNFFTISTLPPLTMFLLFLSVALEIYHDRYVFFMHGLIRPRFPVADPEKAKGGYWKSEAKRRQESESNLEKRYRRWEMRDKPIASYFILLASLHTPFIFFFPGNVKNAFGFGSMAIFVVASLVIPLILGAKTLREKSKEKKEAERLREEQEKREELGRWK